MSIQDARKLKYRPDIDGLRAVAVLLVVGFHIIPEWVRGGFIGVDIFFVISGFLISSIIFESLDDGTFSIREFYIRRVKRIFPSLIVLLVASTVVGCFALFSDELKELGKHVAGGAGFISNFVFLNESGYFDKASETKPLLHLWSLGVEEQFYLFWPFMVLVAWKLNRINFFLVLLFILSFYFNIHNIEKYPAFVFYAPHTRFWELFSGSLLAWFFLYKKNVLQKVDSKIQLNIASLIGFGCISLGAFFLDKNSRFPGVLALLPVLGALLIIFSGPNAWINKNVLSTKIFVFLGLISYPLYLWHWSLYSFFKIIENEMNTIARILIFTLSILLSFLTYKYVEKPFRYGGSAKKKFIFLLALMSIVGFGGYGIYQNNGFPNRSVNHVLGLNSFELTYKESCKPFTLTNYDDDACHLSESSEETSVLLLGDSHANAFSTALSSLRKEVKFDFLQLGRGQCPGLIDFGWESCREIANKAFEYAKSPHVKSIILASRWQNYIYGFKREGVVTSSLDFKKSFLKTIEAYKKLGKKISVVLTIPLYNDPKRCLIRPFRFTDHQSCNIPVSKVIQNEVHYRHFMNLVQIRYRDLIYFDPSVFLCDASFCKIIDGDKILYINESHLSVFGGEFLEKHGHETLLKMISY